MMEQIMISYFIKTLFSLCFGVDMFIAYKELQNVTLIPFPNYSIFFDAKCYISPVEFLNCF